VLLVGLVVGLVVWGVDPDPNQFLAAVSLNYSTVRIDDVSCLSIDPHKVVFDQKDYWDPKLVEAIVDTLSINPVLFNADYATCPWGFLSLLYQGRYLPFDTMDNSQDISFRSGSASELSMGR